MVYLENYVVCTMTYFMEVFHLCRRTCHYSSRLNYGKTGQKTSKITVPQHCYKASSKTMFRVLQPMFKSVWQQIRLCCKLREY